MRRLVESIPSICSFSWQRVRHTSDLYARQTLLSSFFSPEIPRNFSLKRLSFSDAVSPRSAKRFATDFPLGRKTSVCLFLLVCLSQNFSSIRCDVIVNSFVSSRCIEHRRARRTSLPVGAMCGHRSTFRWRAERSFLVPSRWRVKQLHHLGRRQLSALKNSRRSSTDSKAYAMNRRNWCRKPKISKWI